MFGPQLVLEEGVKRGLHLGAQLYVNFKGKIIFDFACGEARTGVPMRTDSIVQWFSSGKPLTAIAIAQLCEKGLVELAAPVSRYLPEFAQNGKGGISIEHLLTHTGGFRGADKVLSDVSWEEAIQYICEAPLEDGWVPGERAGYSTVASW
ncbi:MAG: serine hydrolase domain-containing protein, partial [Limisphaerales bacterium]